MPGAKRRRAEFEGGGGGCPAGRRAGAMFEHGEACPAIPSGRPSCTARRPAGSAEAMYSLGWMYANGRGVPRDDGHRCHLLRDGALQGHEGAGKARRVAGDTPARCPVPGRTASSGPSIRDNWDTCRNLALPARKKKVVELITCWRRFLHRAAAGAGDRDDRINFDAKRPVAQERDGRDAVDPRDGEPLQREGQLRSGGEHQGRLVYLRWLLAYYRGMWRWRWLATTPAKGR